MTEKYIYYPATEEFAQLNGEETIMNKISELRHHGYVSIDVNEKTRSTAFPENTKRYGGAFEMVRSFDGLVQTLHNDRYTDELIFSILENEVTVEYETRGCSTVNVRFTSPDRLNEIQREQAVESMKDEFERINKVESVQYQKYDNKENTDYEKVIFDIEVSTRPTRGSTKFSNRCQKSHFEIPYHMSSVVNPVRGVLSKFEDLCVNKIEYMTTPDKDKKELHNRYDSSKIKVKLSIE
jgi:hypothetical protein